MGITDVTTCFSLKASAYAYTKFLICLVREPGQRKGRARARQSFLNLVPVLWFWQSAIVGVSVFVPEAQQPGDDIAPPAASASAQSPLLSLEFL